MPSAESTPTCHDARKSAWELQRSWLRSFRGQRRTYALPATAGVERDADFNGSPRSLRAPTGWLKAWPSTARSRGSKRWDGWAASLGVRISMPQFRPVVAGTRRGRVRAHGETLRVPPVGWNRYPPRYHQEGIPATKQRRIISRYLGDVLLTGVALFRLRPSMSSHASWPTGSLILRCRAQTFDWCCITSVLPLRRHPIEATERFRRMLLSTLTTGEGCHVVHAYSVN